MELVVLISTACIRTSGKKPPFSFRTQSPFHYAAPPLRYAAPSVILIPNDTTPEMFHLFSRTRFFFSSFCMTWCFCTTAHIHLNTHTHSNKSNCTYSATETQQQNDWQQVLRMNNAQPCRYVRIDLNVLVVAKWFDAIRRPLNCPTVHANVAQTSRPLHNYKDLIWEWNLQEA